MKKAIKWIFGSLAGGMAFLVPLQVFAAEEEETLGQRMSFALQNTIIGIIVVFGMLLLIALIIYLFRFLPKLMNLFTRKKKETGSEQKQEKEQEKVKEKAAAGKQIPPPGPETVKAAPQADYTELIAVIAAAIAADEQVPVGSFVVRTIKKRA